MVPRHELRDRSAHRHFVELLAPLAKLDGNGRGFVATAVANREHGAQEAFLQRRLDSSASALPSNPVRSTPPTAVILVPRMKSIVSTREVV